uniref:Uncharacterized protein n=1 Tax=Ananas comosus var. bracteatus TaxID=296719 RepID=A0A6V7QHJ3_ANACO|nr:unnamed protein product [Ananas comosus var. bracteatus]
MPSGPRKRKAQRRKKEEREKELEKEKQKEKEEVKEKLNSPTTSSSSQDFNHSKKDINYNEESSKDDTGSSSSSSSSSSEEDGEKKKGAADGGEDEAAVGEVKVAEEIEIAIAIEKRVAPPVGDGAGAVPVPDEGADKPFDVLIERDDKLPHESAERAVLSDPSDCPAGESIREEEELCCRESEETEAAPAPLLEHRTAWWNCCGMLDAFAGSKKD